MSGRADAPGGEETVDPPGGDEAADGPETGDEAGGADEPLDPEAVDRDAAARGALYSILARGFRHPDEELHGAAAAGELRAEVEALVESAALDIAVPALGTDDDYETLCARYNDLFVIGFAAYEDRTDGSLATDGPPVPLYESTYRPEASWGDVNLDLARAYEYFGLGVDQDDRDNHDALPLQLEFAAYLARREAVGEAGAAAARLDLLDRHLSYVAAGVCERLADESGTGLYGHLGDLLAALVQAEQADLGKRRDEGAFDGNDGAFEGDRGAFEGDGGAVEGDADAVDSRGAERDGEADPS